MTDYVATFERIGRHHEVEPMTFEDVTEPDELAALIHRRAARYLGSRFYEVWVNLNPGRGEQPHGGIVVGGMRPAGNFTIAEKGADA